MKKLAEKIIDQLEILLEMEISAYILNDAKQLAFIKLLYKRRTDISVIPHDFFHLILPHNA